MAEGGEETTVTETPVTADDVGTKIEESTPTEEKKKEEKEEGGGDENKKEDDNKKKPVTLSAGAAAAAAAAGEKPAAAPAAATSKPAAGGPAPVNHEQLSCNALVIFGLPPTIKQDDMKTKMEEYGPVTRVEIRRAFASVYCFCDYETGEQAQAAISALNGTKFQERYTLIVKLANDKKERSKPQTDDSLSSSPSKKQKTTA